MTTLCQTLIKMATHTQALMFWTLYHKKKQPPQILSQLWLSLFDCCTVVYTVTEAELEREIRGGKHLFWLTWSLVSFEFSDHIQLKKKKSKKKEKTEVNRRKGTISHRGGAWDGTSVIKKIHCNSIHIRLQVWHQYTVWCVRYLQCMELKLVHVRSNVCCLQEAGGLQSFLQSWLFFL